MSLRFNAVEELTGNHQVDIESTNKISNIFGSNVFTLKVAREFLSDEAYRSLVNSIRSGQKIDRAVANQIATGMRAWGRP